MRKLLGTFFNLLTLLFILLLVAVGALLLVVDPDRHRQSLEQAVLAQSGLRLEIAGDMSLMLQPYVGIRLHDLRIRDSLQPRELGSVSSLSIRVDPWRLIRGQVVMQELNAEHVHINWYTDTKGDNSWEQIFREQADQTPSIDPAATIQNAITLVTVTESSIDLQDHQRGSHYSIRNLEFTGRESNTVETGFRIRAEFDWSDETGRPPSRLVVSSLNRTNLRSGDISVEEFQITYTPVQLNGDMEIRDLFSNTSWSGKLVSNTFPLTDLLINFGVLQDQQTDVFLSPETQAYSDEMTIQVTFNGDARQLRIPSSTVTLGDMTANADAILRYSDGLSPSNITYSIQTNALDPGPFLHESTNVAALQEAEPPSAFTLQSADDHFTLPVDWFDGKNIQGSIAIESLRFQSFQTGAFNVFTNLEDRVLDLEVQPRVFQGGSTRGNLRIDARTAEALVSLQLASQSMDLAPLQLPVLQQNAVAGQLDLEAGFQARGNTIEAWLENVTGYAVFKLNNNLVDIGVVKQVFTAITALSPTADSIQQWPDAMLFSNLGGYAVINNGIETGQQIQIRMDNINLAGEGGFNLEDGTFNYAMRFAVLGDPLPQAVQMNELYWNVQWPVQCTASFAADPGQFCRPDFRTVRELYLMLGDGRLQPALADILAEPLPSLLPETASLLLPGFPIEPQ